MSMSMSSQLSHGTTFIKIGTALCPWCSEKKESANLSNKSIVWCFESVNFWLSRETSPRSQGTLSVRGQWLLKLMCGVAKIEQKLSFNFCEDFLPPGKKRGVCTARKLYWHSKKKLNVLSSSTTPIRWNIILSWEWSWLCFFGNSRLNCCTTMFLRRIKMGMLCKISLMANKVYFQ